MRAVKVAGMWAALMVLPSCMMMMNGDGNKRSDREDTHGEGNQQQKPSRSADLGITLGCEQSSSKHVDSVAKPDIAFGCDQSSGEHINLATHKGLICVGKGSLFKLSLAAKSATEVQFGICDGDGKLIEDALMMWHQTEMLAKTVQGVVTFEKLFIARDLPADAELRVAGAQQASSANKYLAFDIATLLPSGVSFSYDNARVLESYPVQYRWNLSYWPKLELGNKIDWYILTDSNKSKDSTSKVSKIMQTEVTDDNYQVLGNNVNPSLSLGAMQPHDDDKDGDALLQELPDCYRLVTKIARGVKAASNNTTDTEVVVAVGKQLGNCDT